MAAESCMFIIFSSFLLPLIGFNGKTPLTAYFYVSFPFLSAIRAWHFPPFFNVVRGNSMEYLLRSSRNVGNRENLSLNAVSNRFRSSFLSGWLSKISFQVSFFLLMINFVTHFRTASFLSGRLPPSCCLHKSRKARSALARLQVGLQAVQEVVPILACLLIDLIFLYEPIMSEEKSGPVVERLKLPGDTGPCPLWRTLPGDPMNVL